MYFVWKKEGRNYRIGAVTPVGTDVETAWENIKKGVSGIGRLTRIDPELFPAKVAAEINDFEVEKYIDKKEARRMDRFTQYAVAAAKMAVADAKLEITEENGPRIGVWIGSGIGGMETYEEQFKILLRKVRAALSPFFRTDDDSRYGSRPSINRNRSKRN